VSHTKLRDCNGQPFIRCRIPAIPVGSKNVTVTVGGQNSTYLFDLSSQGFPKLQTRCPKDWYGADGEYCINCRGETPFGENSANAAKCEDPNEKSWGYEPVANPGWWKKMFKNTDVVDDGMATWSMFARMLYNAPTVRNAQEC